MEIVITLVIFVGLVNTVDGDGDVLGSVENESKTREAREYHTLRSLRSYNHRC